MGASVFFWIVATVLALCVAALMALAMIRRAASQTPDEAASDVEVYRAQLGEIDRDVARGVITSDEAERLRVEVSRRLLAADAEGRGTAAGEAPPQLNGFGAALVGIGTLAGAALLYLWIGAPGAQDQPHALRLAEADATRLDRISQAEREAQLRVPFTPPPDVAPSFLQLMDRLREAVAENPDELEGQELLARNEARLGNFRAAHVAQAKVIALKGDGAELGDYAAYADLLVLAADGYVSPEAEAAVDRILNDDPLNGAARYYKGLVYGQSGRHDLAYEMWNDLLGDSRVTDPWVPLVMGQIENVARAAGVRFRPPQLASAQPGPSAEDVEAASEMSVEDRNAMIRGMVEGLGERLSREGGPPEDWARLIQSLGVLGETERAALIWQEAQSAFAAYPDAVDMIRLAAEAAGVAQAP
jgi:cytochrome c-type biogenesis protein CcmH